MRKTPAEIATTSSDLEKQEWLSAAPAWEIEEFLRYVNPGDVLWIRARSEMQLRLGGESRRYHRMVASTFWLALVATLLAFISAWPVMFEWGQAEELKDALKELTNGLLYGAIGSSR